MTTENKLLHLSPRAQKVLGAEAVFKRLGFKNDQVHVECQPLAHQGEY